HAPPSAAAPPIIINRTSRRLIGCLNVAVCHVPLVDSRKMMLVRIVGSLLVLALSASPVAAQTPTSILFTRFASAAAFADGAATGFAGGGAPGLVPDGDRLALATAEPSGVWVSPPITPGFAFKRLVASWNADTPADSRLRVEAQVTTTRGETSGWYVLGVWSA